MKGGWIHIPDEAQLEKAYNALLHSTTPKPNSDELAQYANWSRFDPRLAEIWVGYMAEHWQEINPLELRTMALKSPWPATLGVLLEFSKTLVQTNPKSPVENQLYKHWNKLVVTSLPPAKSELYFIGLRPLGSAETLNDASLSSLEYEKWGYLSRENLLAKKRVAGSSRISRISCISKDKRLAILIDLVKVGRLLRTPDYWDAIDRCISLRQAERDIKNSGYFKSKGQTRSMVWLRLPRRGIKKTEG